MKTWTRATVMTAIGICIAVGTALAVVWDGSDNVDYMYLKEGNDRIYADYGDDNIEMGYGNDTITMQFGNDIFMTGWGQDEINLGPARTDDQSEEGDYDVISFYDGNAALLFHDAAAAPTRKASIEYVESDESLTVYAAADFIIDLH